jgi:cobalt-zinc-cadmium efflux system outer membrane protein
MKASRLLILLVTGLLAAACTSTARHERTVFHAEDERRYAGIATALSNSSGDTAPSMLNDSGVLHLDTLLHEAEVRSPRLAAAFETWRAAVSGITTSTALPDARLSYRHFMNSIDARVGPVEHMVVLEQMVPNPGKLAARQRGAASSAAAARSNFDEIRLSIREQVILAYADVQALDARIVITARIAELLRDIEGVVESRVRANLASQSALLRVQVEAERLESDLVGLSQRRQSLLTALEAASGVLLPPDAQVESLPSGLPNTLPPRPVLVALVLDHPSVQAEFAKRGVAAARLDEAKWMWAPDMMFGVEYMVMDRMESRMGDGGRHGLGFMAGITVPWQFHVNAARTDQARAMERAARHTIEQTRLDLLVRLDAQRYAHDDAMRLVELLDQSVLPKARQTLELVRADFTTDRATLTDVLDAERSLLAAELSLINARTDLIKARARLRTLVAAQLDALE